MDSFTLISFGQTAVRFFLLAGLVTFVMAAGEWALEFNIKKAVKCLNEAANLYVESKGEKGTVWPLLLFMLGVPAILAFLLG